MRIQETIDKLKDWGEKNEHAQAIILIGSHARTQNRSDKWSDIDAILFTSQPQKYQNENSWLHGINVPISCYNGLEVAESTFVKRVFFEDGVGMDITPVQASSIDLAYVYALVSNRTPLLLNLVPSSSRKKLEKSMRSFAYYIHRGMLILVDKKGYKEKLRVIEHRFRYTPPPKPTIEEFERQTSEFWQNAFRMAIKLKRKEFFTARIECETPMKLNLLTIIEWHAKCINGWDFETWHKGRYIEKWADPKIVEGLKNLYGRYNEKDSWDSLFNTLKLFERVSHEVESYLGYNCNRISEQRIKEWIEDLHSQSEIGNNLPSALTDSSN